MEKLISLLVEDVPIALECGNIELIIWVYKGGYEKTASPFLIELFRLTNFHHESN